MIRTIATTPSTTIAAMAPMSRPRDEDFFGGGL
jgi:hypothetical protein